MKHYVQHKIIPTICKYIATLGPVGYLPAPGTMGTLCAFPLVYFFAYLSWRLPVYFDVGFVVALFILASIWIIGQALPLMHEDDPSEIVLDEVVGFVLTLYMMPLNWVSLIFGFTLFRFFDIIKPFGITYIERIRGAFGIVCDDIAAAVMARLALALVFKVAGLL